MRLVFLSLFLLGAHPALAKDFGTVLENFKSNPSTLEDYGWFLYVKGVNEGFLWHSSVTIVEFGERARLYCPPPKLAITEENVIQIGKSYLAENPEAYTSPYGLRILMAMQETFPCD